MLCAGVFGSDSEEDGERWALVPYVSPRPVAAWSTPIDVDRFCPSPSPEVVSVHSSPAASPSPSHVLSPSVSPLPEFVVPPTTLPSTAVASVAGPSTAPVCSPFSQSSFVSFPAPMASFTLDFSRSSMQATASLPIRRGGMMSNADGHYMYLEFS